MGKTGPISQLKETMRQIRSLLLEKPSLSAREIREHIKDKGVPSSYQKIKQALDQLIKREEVTVKEAPAGRGSIPKKVYQLRGKGREKAQKTVMISEHVKELQALSRDELILRLARYQLIQKIRTKYNNLPPKQKIVVLQKWREQGDPMASEKLEKIEKLGQKWEQYKKEIADAPPDKEFEVLMKWRQEFNRLEQGQDSS